MCARTDVTWLQDFSVLVVTQPLPLSDLASWEMLRSDQACTHSDMSAYGTNPWRRFHLTNWEGSHRALRCFMLTAQIVHCAGGCATHLGTVGTTAYSATHVSPCAEGNDLERFCPIRHRSNKQPELRRSGFFCRPGENNRHGS